MNIVCLEFSLCVSDNLREKFPIDRVFFRLASKERADSLCYYGVECAGLVNCVMPHFAYEKWLNSNLTILFQTSEIGLFDLLWMSTPQIFPYMSKLMCEKWVRSWEMWVVVELIKWPHWQHLQNELHCGGFGKWNFSTNRCTVHSSEPQIRKWNSRYTCVPLEH